ncbi:hypothetical protein O181_044785 [Austropuccinia psidii MF-1]|uniref:Uncharacterized protein n=1 Tax=Austropuccinia psidii MF-1 TaxID=1389203 RepID=A0A9Q3DQ44_9BASI|nr:hypothetical protein [Austropuccinia psidii MF-1]
MIGVQTTAGTSSAVRAAGAGCGPCRSSISRPSSRATDVGIRRRARAASAGCGRPASEPLRFAARRRDYTNGPRATATVTEARGELVPRSTLVELKLASHASAGSCRRHTHSTHAQRWRLERVTRVGLEDVTAREPGASPYKQ